MRTLLVSTLTLLLAGCSSSSSGVIPSGIDEFTIVYTGDTGAASTGKMKIQAYKDAEAFCNSKGKQLDILSTDIPPGPYVLGKYPQVEVKFTCLVI